MAFDVKAVTLLGDLTEAMRENYLSDELYEHYGWWGKKINRLFDFSTNHDIEGENHYWQCEVTKARAVRTSRDITSGFNNHATFTVKRLRARLSETAANNDFSRFDGSARVSLFDLERGAKNPDQYVTNTVPRLVDQLIAGAAESLAMHRMLDASALLGTVTAAAKQNDNILYASATSTPVNGGTTGIRVTVSGMLVGFQPGTIVTIYSGSTSTIKVTNAIVTDYNPVDNSIGLKRWDVTTRAATTNGNSNPENLIGVTTNDTVFLSGERNLGMVSMAEWFATAPTGGESFFGIDRSIPDNSWMRPTTYAATSSGTVTFDKAHLDNLAIHMGYVAEGFMADKAYVALMSPAIGQQFRNQVGSQNIVLMPTTEQAGVLARYGFDGSVYVHPSFGRISLTEDAMAIPNRMLLVRPGDWKCLVGRDFSPVPRATAIAGWYDVKSTSDGTATLEYQTDYMGLKCDVCMYPRNQAQITGIAG